ncbi:MAG: hypothetical protein KGL10_08630 [Alphaproteobacteria bacterium]|nr:hypothetical protein [Alphaproteobacteria bacterium]
MQTQLSTAELQTLAALSSRDRGADIPRLHLEKLLRLDLIEPARGGICLTGVGKEILVRMK